MGCRFAFADLSRNWRASMRVVLREATGAVLVHKPPRGADVDDVDLAGPLAGLRVEEAPLRRDERGGVRGADGRAERLAGVAVEPGRDVHGEDRVAGGVHGGNDLVV